MSARFLGPKSTFRATVILLNPNCHTNKSVYITVKVFKYEAEWSQFTRIGQVITLHHCEKMRLILEYKDYLEQAAASFDMSEGADTSTPAVESNEEEEDKPVMFRRPQMRAKTAAKNTLSKKNTKKTTKQTDEIGKTLSTSVTTKTATTTETEKVLTESDE